MNDFYPRLIKSCSGKTREGFYHLWRVDKSSYHIYHSPSPINWDDFPSTPSILLAVISTDLTSPRVISLNGEPWADDLREGLSLIESIR